MEAKHSFIDLKSLAWFYYLRGFKKIILGNLGLKHVSFTFQNWSMYSLFNLTDSHLLPVSIRLFTEIQLEAMLS